MKFFKKLNNRYTHENNPFQSLSERYEAWFDSHFNIYQSELSVIKEFITDGSKGIEIGIGTGRFSLPLNIPIGVEPSKEMAKIARLKGINVIEAKAEDLPIDNESFGFALFVTTICFLDDIDKSLKEAYRIIKDPGYIVVAFIDKSSIIGKLYQKKKNGEHHNSFYQNARFYSVKEVVNHLKRAGFHDFNYRQTIDNLDNNSIQTIKEGYGEGCFIVIKAKKH
jgi:ubiquinone/menaquinone biosynthesis C-methylase UbiE